MNELAKINVRFEKEQTVTDSRNVAEVFGKQHKHVLDSIRSLEKDVPNFGLMFSESEMPDSYGRLQKVYLMNRDGFTLLAMGFTGAGAMQWKLKYIEAFNQMEAGLNTPERIMARALKIADQTIHSLETRIEEQKPLVEFAEHVSQSAETVDMGEMAKLATAEGINIGRNRLIDWMKSKKFLMSTRAPYQQYVDAGYMKLVDVPKNTSYGVQTFQKTVFTGKGQIWIVEKLRKEYRKERI